MTVGGCGVAIYMATDHTRLEIFDTLHVPDAGMAHKLFHLSQKIEYKKSELAEIEGRMNANLEGAVLRPGEILKSLRQVRAKIAELNVLLEEVKATGFRLKGSVAKKQVEEIDIKMKKLETDKRLDKAVSLAGKKLPKVRIPGTDISFSPGQSAQILEERDGLKSDLNRMKEIIGQIGDTRLKDISNNMWVNLKGKIPG